jgi:hypothetical protein
MSNVRPPTSQVLLVLGMHRSGTSSVAGMLGLCGAANPKTLLPANDFNERGYFESRPICEFHDRLLQAVGSTWHDWTSIEPASFHLAASFKDEAWALFEQEYGGAPLINFKDPRLCRLMPFWIDVFAANDVIPCTVMPIRSPLEVAQSLEKRDGFSLLQGLLLCWLGHVLASERASRSLPRVIFSWAEFLNDWPAVLRRVEATFGIVWPLRLDDIRQQVDGFLSVDLRHHVVSDDDLQLQSLVHVWVTRTYRAMLQLAEDPESSAALRTLDEIGNKFDESGKLFAALIVEQEKKAIEARHAQATSELAEAVVRETLLSLQAEADARQQEATLLDLSLKRIEQDLQLAEEAKAEAYRAQVASGAAEALARNGLLRLQAEADLQRQELTSLDDNLKRVERDLKLAEDAKQALLQRQHERAVEERQGRITDARAERASRERRSGVLARLSSRRTLRTVAKRIGAHAIFDEAFYLSSYPHVAQSGLDPICHYVERGCYEGCFPHPLFDTRYYLNNVPDALDNGLNAFLHYLEAGWKTANKPNAYFDHEFYHNTYDRPRGPYEVDYFFRVGFALGHDPGPSFSTSFYLSTYDSVRLSGLNPLAHYLQFGRHNGFRPASLDESSCAT